MERAVDCQLTQSSIQLLRDNIMHKASMGTRKGEDFHTRDESH